MGLGGWEEWAVEAGADRQEKKNPRHVHMCGRGWDGGQLERTVENRHF